MVRLALIGSLSLGLALLVFYLFVLVSRYLRRNSEQKTAVAVTEADTVPATAAQKNDAPVKKPRRKRVVKEAAPPAPRKRGRPPGSKNKTKRAKA